MKEEELTIKCDCGEEMLTINDDYPFGFHVAMFDRYCTKYTWRHRLHLIWRIIRYGKPYTDAVIIGYDKAVDLLDFLTQKTKEHKKCEK